MFIYAFMVAFYITLNVSEIALTHGKYQIRIKFHIF